LEGSARDTPDGRGAFSRLGGEKRLKWRKRGRRHITAERNRLCDTRWMEGRGGEGTVASSEEEEGKRKGGGKGTRFSGIGRKKSAADIFD